MTVYTVNNFINGEFQVSEKYIDSINPSNLEQIAKIAVCSSSDLNKAVESAKNAFPIWSSLSYASRSIYVNKLANLIEENIDEFALLESMDQGKTLEQARIIEMPRVLLNFRTFADAPKYMDEKSTENSDMKVFNIRTRSPIGVAAIITPWNLPLYLLSFKLAPCIMYGNTCVCKPSEFTSLTAWKMCEMIKLAGFPKGVINVVFGDGQSVGDALVRYKDIKMITFTGSTITGENILKATAGQIKKFSLELGGKNAAIVFADADLDKAVASCVNSSFVNQGEICLCTSKIYVQNDIYEEFVNAFIENTRKLVVGDPLNPETFIGPLVNEMHMNKVIKYIKNCKGKVRCGYGIDSLNLPGTHKKGFFVPPTVLTDVPADDSILFEEVFGPVTVILRFTTQKEVIDLVNAVQYGLCAVIHTNNQSTAIATAKLLEVGTVWTNCWLIRDLRMPFGGVKSSGIGREGQEESRDFYTELKTICMKY